jgi:hypothetical protein
MALVSQARLHGIQPLELQIDFDCPESKLAGYALWLDAIRQAVAPTPVTITALPSWLDQPSFKQLASRLPCYVLQVHSLVRPSSTADMPPLCDPQAARVAVRKAARLGTPFLVALPTYGYNVAFDSQGKYLGISAEGPSPAWPDRATIKELAPDPLQLSQLVAEWTRSRPSAMRGVIWYRLPNSDDRLNWRWPTLASVMAGKPPQPDLQAEAIRSEEGSIDLALVNNGSGEFAGSATVQVDCENAITAWRIIRSILPGMSPRARSRRAAGWR